MEERERHTSTEQNNITMENLMSYFSTNYGVDKPGDILWSHAVNGQAKLQRTLKDDSSMFVESDILFSNDGVPIAAHPPATESDLTFDELIDKMKTSKQVLKLDFKDPSIVRACLEKVKEANFSQPLFINADVLTGNSANPSKFDAKEFVRTTQELLPNAVLSLGWTTVADEIFPYTDQNIDEMLALCEGIETVTFPVRACLLPNSGAALARLIQKEGYTLSIWNNEPVSEETIDWIKENTNPEKTFYDFIDDNKDPLKLI